MNATAARDDATRRVRRLTFGLVAGATALTGIFAGIAAASTHTAKRVVHSVTVKSTSTSNTVTAPDPTLVPNGSSASTAPQAQSSAPPQASTSPPVVVSGGS